MAFGCRSFVTGSSREPDKIRPPHDGHLDRRRRFPRPKMMTDDLLGPVLRQDHEPLYGRRSHLKPRFVAAQLTIRRHVPSALGLDDDVEFRRLDLNVGKPAVGLVVFLKLDNDGLRQDNTRREALDEPAEEG